MEASPIDDPNPSAASVAVSRASFEYFQLGIQMENEERFVELVSAGCEKGECYDRLEPLDWKPSCVFSYLPKHVLTSIIRYVLFYGSLWMLRMVLKNRWYTLDQIPQAVYGTNDRSKLDVLLSDSNITSQLAWDAYSSYRWLHRMALGSGTHDCNIVHLILARVPKLITYKPSFEYVQIRDIGCMCPHCRDVLYPFMAEGATVADLHDECFHVCILSIKQYAIADRSRFEFATDSIYDRVFGLMLEFYKGTFIKSEILSIMNNRTYSWCRLLKKHNMHLSGDQYLTEMMVINPRFSNGSDEVAFVMREYDIKAELTYVMARNPCACVYFHRFHAERMVIDIDSINLECLKRIPELIEMLPLERAKPMLTDLVEHSSNVLQKLCGWINTSFPLEMLYNSRLRDIAYETYGYNYGALQLTLQYRRCIAVILMMCQRRGDNPISSLDQNIIRNIARWI